MKTLDLNLAPKERENRFDLTPVVYEHHGIWVPGGLIPACMIPGAQVGENLKPIFAIMGLLAIVCISFVIVAISHLS